MNKSLLFFVIVLFGASCAQVLTPDGGPKDMIPPHVIAYMPDSAKTNFTGNKIVLKFDEYIQLKDLNNQLIISPPLNNDPDVVIRKKEIVITLHDTLLSNTTYTISFGNAIHDITEDNVLENFRYVFSTGPIIDSLRVSGKVVNASALSGEKGILVMLYTDFGDSVPIKQRPYYFTKTQADGSFSMTNLKAGTYKIFALEDKNSNYRYDNEEERIAFSDELIKLNANHDSVDLKIFKEDPVVQKRIKAQQYAGGRFGFSYTLPLKNPQISFSPELPAEMKLYKEYSVTGDSIDFWFNPVSLDSLTFFIHDDATNLNDTVSMMMVKPGDKSRHIRTGANDPRKLYVNPNAVNGQLFDLGKMLFLSTNNPLIVFHPELFLLKIGNDTLKPEISLSENKRQINFNTIFLEDSSYSLFIPPGAMADCFGQKNDTIKLNFKIRESRYYGALNIKFTGLTGGDFILQLINEKGIVFREIKIADKVNAKFDLLPPGTYRMKLISDVNKNGRWDSGNYLQHQQPEKVIYYINPVKMRSGWDMDVEWIFK
ncbi:Ig-like domain-containing protein [soil metagenome]